MGTIFTTEKAIDILGDYVGTVAAQPTSGSFSVVRQYVAGFCRIRITLTAARIPVTDAAGSGSYGSLKLLDLAAGGWRAGITGRIQARPSARVIGGHGSP